MSAALPPGFVEDNAPALPPGFVPDGPAVPQVKNPFAEVGPTVGNTAKLRATQMGPLRRALYGAERGFDEMAMGVKQIVAGLSPEDETELKIRRQTEKEIPRTWVSRTAADVAMAIPLARGVQAVGAIPQLARAGGKALPYATAAGAGALMGGLQPVVDNESRGENVAIGAGFGAAGQGLGNLVGRGVEGLVKKNASVDALPKAIRDRMTLGQVANRNTLSGSIAASTEEKLQSVPLVGNIIRNSRQGATDSWRDELLARTGPRGRIPVGDDTWEKLSDSAQAYTKEYVSALRGKQIPPSRLFETQVASITNNPRSGLTNQQQGEVRDMVMRYYNSMFHGNSPATGPAGTGVVMQGGQRGTPVSIDAQNAKDFEGFLTKMAMQYRKSNAPGSSNMADMFDDMERAWSVSYRRALPSADRKTIKELDRTYAPFKTIERAAAYTGNDKGDFTPQQLVQAVRQRTPQSRFSRGGGILQRDAAAARDTLVDRIPNSGTADRAMTAGALVGAVTNPTEALITLGLAVPAMTTRAGRNVMTGDTKLQEILKALRANQGARNSGTVGGMVAADGLNPEYSEE
jgi:hypothetical protein